MLRLILLIGTILLLTFFLVCLTEQKAGRLIPIAYIILAFVQFIAALLGRLSYFKYLLVVSLALFAGLTVCKYIYIYIRQNKDSSCLRTEFADVLNRFLRPSLIVWALFFVYLFFVFKDYYLSCTDDLYVYGIKLSEMYKSDSLYSSNPGFLYGQNPSEPPFLFLLETAFMKLLGGNADGYALLAISSFTFSLGLFLFDHLENKPKDYLKAPFLFMILLAMTLMVQGNQTMFDKSFIYNCLYSDWVLGILLARVFSDLYIFDKSKTYDFAEIGLFCGVLSLCKQIGVALMLLGVVSTLIYLFLTDRHFYKDHKAVLRSLLLIFIPIVLYAVHRIQVLPFKGSGSVAVGMAGNTFDRLSDSSLVGKIVGNFFNTYFNSPIITHPLPISYFFLSIIIVGALTAIIYFRKDRKMTYAIPILYFLGSLAYTLGILLSYIAFFNNIEAVKTTMFGRYMQTYSYGGLLLIFFILLSREWSWKRSLVALAVVLHLIEPSSVPYVIYGAYHHPYEKQIPLIKQYLSEEYAGQKMLVINQTDFNYRYLFWHYATIYDKNDNITYRQIDPSVTLEIFEDLLKENDLLYVGDFDVAFDENYWSAVSDLDPYNHSLYRIDHENGIDISLIYTWEQ